MARWMILAGAVLLLLGIAWHYFPWLLNWFGRLPGDIRIESERSRVFIPITSMVILSLVLTVLINLFRRETRGQRRTILYFVALLAAWVLGLLNALVHAKDAWAIMPEAMWLSSASALLALVAAVTLVAQLFSLLAQGAFVPLSPRSSSWQIRP